MTALVLLAASVLLALEALVVWGGVTRLKGEPDVVVVLGAKLWGEQPSPALRNRLDAALDYLRALQAQGCMPTVVVTGGQGEDEVLSEAQCMGDYLVRGGIAPERIIREDKSTNTAENLKNTKAVLLQRGITGKNVTFVSNYFHLTRVRMLAARLTPEWQVSTLGSSVPDLSSGLYSYCRETVALVKSFLFDR
jgi:uncharacterized SAM-binding protein YcdF (DUF218 family)